MTTTTLSYLVVLSSDVHAFHPFLMSNLREKPAYKSLFDTIVVLFFVIDRYNVQVISFHDAHKLGTNVIRLR